MKMIDIEKAEERKQFAVEAAAHFTTTDNTSYTTGEIKKGELFALRFGLDNDCVVVFRLDEFEDVENYQNIIYVDKRN